jgi:hypothetical protein
VAGSALRNLLEPDRMFTGRLYEDMKCLELRVIEVDTTMTEAGLAGASDESIRTLSGHHLAEAVCAITLKGGCRWLLAVAELNLGRTRQGWRRNGPRIWAHDPRGREGRGFTPLGIPTPARWLLGW